MRPAKRSTDAHDAGSASLEFLTVGLLLMVPLVYLVLVTASLQAAALAVEGAARQAARVYVQQGSAAEADAAADRAIRITLADYGVTADQLSVRVDCTPVPSDCLTRRGYVTFHIDVLVPLPMTPPALTLDVPAGVRLGASATAQVSRFWGDG